MSANTRRQHILEELMSTGRARVAKLANQLYVADKTLRRDLVALEQRGELVRIHGRAVTALGSRTHETQLGERIQQQHEAKVAIAERAYELLSECGSATGSSTQPSLGPSSPTGSPGLKNSAAS